MVYSKADFKNDTETIEIDSFKLKSAIQAYLFIRKKRDKIETITLSYRNYAPHGFYIDGVSVDIYFSKLEDIINPLLDKFNIQNRYGNTTIQKSLTNIQVVDYLYLKSEINNQISFNAVSNEIKKIISLGVIPFFEKYNTLETVNNNLSRMSDNEIRFFYRG